MYRKGRARKGPTFREAILMHAVARLVLHPHITNIQASWVKLGMDGLRACLDAGVNDVGGTLMNESISRAAGASHGQEFTAAGMRDLITAAGRVPQQRTTRYEAVTEGAGDTLPQSPFPCKRESSQILGRPAGDTKFLFHWMPGQARHGKGRGVP